MERIPESQWKWFGNAGHLIIASWCRFHLCTQIGEYMISTVGEYWPDRPVREIHADVHDPEWLKQYGILRGDTFDAKYLERFGYEEIGCDRKFETMVFKAGAPCKTKDCDCGLPWPTEWGKLNSNGYNTAGDATRGHMAMCEKWAAGVPAESRDVTVP
jgi:hypothetical protein